MASGSLGGSTTYLCQRKRGQWPGQPSRNTHQGQGRPHLPRTEVDQAQGPQLPTPIKYFLLMKPSRGPLDTPTRTSPGSQGAAQHMLHVPIAASGEGVHAPAKLPCHLWTRDPSASLATQGPGQGGQRNRQGQLGFLMGWAGSAQGCPHPGHPSLSL